MPVIGFFCEEIIDEMICEAFRRCISKFCHRKAAPSLPAPCLWLLLPFLLASLSSRARVSASIISASFSGLFLVLPLRQNLPLFDLAHWITLTNAITYSDFPDNSFGRKQNFSKKEG